ncbi:MAG: TetR/AcrR family transcriptional regulator [Anaerolineales bacterium]|nr:TetR/AcrR family transcriptional regulator [Anaerolineales bacterium]
MDLQRKMSRSERKRQAILNVALALFLDKGYTATSMDEIATGAAVSKQTVYQHFSSKENLFQTLVTDICDQAAAISEGIEQQLATVEELAPGLHTLAQSYLRNVIKPEVMKLRRLIIAEKERFPDIASHYHAAAPGSALNALAKGFAQLQNRQLLNSNSDPMVLAEMFAYTLLGPFIDKALFLGNYPSEPEIEQFIAARIDHLIAIMRP